jgi:hypothetical protein
MAYFYNKIRCPGNDVLELEDNTWRTAVPQAFIRRSMLRLLATKYGFSKPFCDSIDSVSFETSESAPTRPAEKEHIMVSALVSEVLEHIEGALWSFNTSEEESDSADSEDPTYEGLYDDDDDDDDD